jgi:hypothetical protein
MLAGSRADATRESLCESCICPLWRTRWGNRPFRRRTPTVQRIGYRELSTCSLVGLTGALEFAARHVSVNTLEMSEMRPALRQSQPVPFLLAHHPAPASCQQNSPRRRPLPHLRKTGKVLRPGTRGARKNSHRLPGPYELRCRSSKARSPDRPRSPGSPTEKFPFREDRIYLPTQPRPFLPLLLPQ